MTEQDPHEQIGAAIRATAARVRAPASLRARIAADRLAGLPQPVVSVLSAPRPRGPRRVRVLLGTGAAACAACIAALAFALAGGPGDAPTVAQAASIALGPATASPPHPQPGNPHVLATGVDGLRFPAWRSGGWRVVGQRRVRLDGREVVTVFYTRRDGQRVGYAIVGGSALAVPDEGHAVTLGGVRFALLRRGAARVVTWWQAGHTCILAGKRVTSEQLLALAAASASSPY